MITIKTKYFIKGIKYRYPIVNHNPNNIQTLLRLTKKHAARFCDVISQATPLSSIIRHMIISLFQTFCVVSKRFRKNYIHRFTATSSFFMFSPWSPTRRACIFLCTNQYFDYVVMATILLNCVFLAMTETVEEAE